MNTELHLFILWEKSKSFWDKILNDIKNKFIVIKIFKVHWSSEHFSTNLTRFYGVNLPPKSHKEKHCGTGPFILVVVQDKNPKYAERKTSKGVKTININTFDAKTLYRKWTGGGHKIHGTNSLSETNHDLALLFNMNSNEFMAKYNSKSNDTITQLYSDLIGTTKWQNIEQLFSVLNSTTNYVILRNHECLPDQYTFKSHSDIDILTENYQEICFITNAKQVFKNSHRVYNKVKIGDEDVFFDFRYLGDKYYCKSWEENILKDKIISSKGFYTPSDSDYFFSLLYHVLIHKWKIKPDYKKKLVQLSKNININNLTEKSFDNPKHLKQFLDKYLNQNKYFYTRPIDSSVFINKKLVGDI